MFYRPCLYRQGLYFFERSGSFTASRYKLTTMTTLERLQMRPLRTTIFTVLIIAVLSLLSNITTQAQLEGNANGLLFARFTLSKLLNAGTLWAGIGIWVGWLFARPLPALCISVLGALSTLSIHYALGQLIGIYQPSIWIENWTWFLLAVIAIAPLSQVGVLARRSSWVGLLARCVLPAGALAEPFVTGLFSYPAIIPWPNRYSAYLVGAVLVISGLTGLLDVVLRNRDKLKGKNKSDRRRPER